MTEIVHPSLITDNPYQVRSDYDDVEELAERIEAKRASFPATRGLMQVPIGRLAYTDGTVIDGPALGGALQRIADEGWPAGLRVQLAFGHRRLRAFRNLCDRDPGRYDGMPVQIVDLTDDQMLDAVWSENRERKDISAVEEAELLARKLSQVKEAGGSQQDVADEWGISRPTVANRLRLLDLPYELQAANRAGTLSERQLLALAPVVKLGQMANGVEWNEEPESQGWKGPGAPAWFIEHVLAEPETTSDAIRDYLKTAQLHAGVEIPEAVAGLELDRPGIVQATCKGCPMRINQFCMHRTCFDHKLIAFGDRAAQLLSKELGVPAGLLIEPDESQRFEFRQRLTKLVEAGLTDNLVLAWTTGYGVYAAPNRGWEKNRWQEDGRYGVVYGHKAGKVSDAEFEQARQIVAAAADAQPESAEVESGPGSKLINAWREQMTLLCDQLRDEMYRELQDRTAYLAGIFIQMQPLLATLMHASFEKYLNIPDPGDALAAIANQAWDNSYLKHDDADKLAETAERMGIHLDPEVVALANLLDKLGGFYRDTWNNRRVAEMLLAANERWLAPEFEGSALVLLPDMGKSLDGWLSKAVVEAQAVLEAIELEKSEMVEEAA